MTTHINVVRNWSKSQNQYCIHNNVSLHITHTQMQLYIVYSKLLLFFLSINAGISFAPIRPLTHAPALCANFNASSCVQIHKCHSVHESIFTMLFHNLFSAILSPNQSHLGRCPQLEEIRFHLIVKSPIVATWCHWGLNLRPTMSSPTP